jgi:hypothetical protein
MDFITNNRERKRAWAIYSTLLSPRTVASTAGVRYAPSRPGCAPGGQTWSQKGNPSLFSSGVTAEAATTHQAVLIHPFTGEDRRGFYAPERVRIESADATTLEDRDHPREAFAGHTVESPWDHLHSLYFAGYALWTYFNLPFLAAHPDIDVEEIDPWEEEPGQQWRRLRLVFPRHIATHYLYDYTDRDGIMFPALRKVARRNADNRPDSLSDPEQLLIGIEFAGYTLG